MQGGKVLRGRLNDQLNTPKKRRKLTLKTSKEKETKAPNEKPTLCLYYGRRHPLLGNWALKQYFLLKMTNPQLTIVRGANGTRRNAVHLQILNNFTRLLVDKSATAKRWRWRRRQLAHDSPQPSGSQHRHQHVVALSSVSCPCVVRSCWCNIVHKASCVDENLSLSFLGPLQVQSQQSALWGL